MKSLLLYLILCLLFLVNCTTNSTPQDDCTELQEILLYISQKDGKFDIFKNNLQGQETKLTQNQGYDWYPHWNPTLKSIIYNAYEGDTFRIKNMDLEGHQLVFSTNGLEEYNLSPNGEKLVAQISEGDFSKLTITDTNGNNPIDITDAKAYNGRAKWSPDSQSILYISDRDGNNEIYLYSLKDQSTRRLTQNVTNEKYCSWAPDSKRFAYTTQYYEEGKPDRNDVFVMSLESGQTVQITQNIYDDSEIAWSPISDRIAFHSKRDTIDHIFTMKSDGTDIQQISTANTYHGEPNWAIIEVKCEL